MLHWTNIRIKNLSPFSANNLYCVELLRQVGELMDEVKATILDLVPNQNGITYRVRTKHVPLVLAIYDITYRGFVEQENILLIKVVHCFLDMVGEVRGEKTQLRKVLMVSRNLGMENGFAI